jgi:NAD(P)H-flavin reductase
VLVEGPHGRLSERARRADGILLLGAGVGMAPIRALAEALSYTPGRATLVHRFGDHELFADELEAVAARRGLQIVRASGPRRRPDSWLGVGGDVAPDALSDLDALRSWVPDLQHRDVYLCGPPAWTALVTSDLKRAGVPARQIHLETFAW